MTVLLVALGAAVGAPLRYLVDRAMRPRHGAGLPWGILAVNLLGSFVLGLLTGAGVDPVVAAAVGTGFCGTLTTYSTFSYDTFVLAERRMPAAAAANLVGNLVAGLAVAAAGYLLGAAITS